MIVPYFTCLSACEIMLNHFEIPLALYMPLEIMLLSILLLNHSKTAKDLFQEFPFPL